MTNIKQIQSEINNMRKKLEHDKVKRDKFFNIIREIHRDTKISDNILFQKYVIDTYGIDVIDYDGYVTNKFVIINEQKYLLFRIKFGI